jgi:hypothetical protein
MLVAGNLCRRPYEVTQQRAINLIGIGHGAYVTAGDDEDVDWRLGMKVGECVAELILIDGRGGNDSFNDLAEQAAHSESSVHARSCHGNEMSSNERGTRMCWFHFEPRPFCNAKSGKMLLG